ncbi:filamentous hemagglutinin N-terminal domain-containing protein [Lyngbya sp. CCY1209]|uniref:two-partner secretion domain-containing protein n=1 Tax=Lyngbya sp. CCY1209 TaxID=2886103 RepID=UPI002D208019|nr:filamentous hemagglutinin N-terminal domain-containing protein [Lyngbya sp. CCY1209]MEB3886965.1 filamentous hemagglutinin N-terminal domain-containing protein [Lyngbya sp. CCY1209]
MKSSWLKLSLGLICDATMAVILFPAIAQTQPVTPAADGTGTVVDVQGNQFDIRGGSLAGDGQNLFHSFQQFGLSEGQVANFLSNPEIRNILGRVVGGDASIIHGLIQVTGGNSNLFLMNPAGIVFGPNARLNVPGDFTVTTATGIEFGNNWFDAIADNNYRSFVGTPSGYLFAIDRPGAIVNQGNLTLDAGHNLTLLGGTVINTGNLSVSGGNITIAAVPGESRVRISHVGQLLSLEISALPSESTHHYPITPLDFPQLLAGDDTVNANTVSVNTNGEIVLGHSETTVPNRAGSAIASGTLSTAETESGTGGTVGIFGEAVAVVDGEISASGTDGGGSIYVGGGYRGNGDFPNSRTTTIDGLSVLSANSITGDGGDIVIWSDGNTYFSGTATAMGINGGFVEVSGEGNLQFLGSVNVGGISGEPGTLLLDPRNLTVVEGGEGETTREGDSIVSTNSLAESEGNIILDADNDITVEGDIVVETSVELRAGRSINLKADIDTSAGNGEISLFGNRDEMDGNVREAGAANIFQAEGTRLNAGEGNIFIELGGLGEVGNIELGNLTTTGDLTVHANGGSVFRGAGTPLIEAGRASFITAGDGQIGSISEPLGIDAGNLEAAAGLGGLFFQAVGDVTVGGVTDELSGLTTTGGGEIVLNAGGDLRVAENISTATIEEAGRTGNITLDAEGEVDTTGGVIDSTALSGRGGDIQITATDDMMTGDIISGALGVRRESATVGDGDLNSENLQPGQPPPPGGSPPNGGNITLASREGNIDTTGGELYSGALAGEGGNMTLEAAGDVAVGVLDAAGEVEGGNITLIGSPW